MQGSISKVLLLPDCPNKVVQAYWKEVRKRKELGSLVMVSTFQAGTLNMGSYLVRAQEEPCQTTTFHAVDFA